MNSNSVSGKIILTTVLVIMLATTVTAAQVGLVVDLDGELHKECFIIEDNSDGYAVLNYADLDFGWADASSFGHALCNINGIGDDVSGTGCAWGDEYWGFLTENGAEWGYMPVGFDTPGDCWNGDYDSFGGHYCAQDGDVIGLAFGEFGSQPEFVAFEDICKLEVDKIKSYVDGEKESLDIGDKIKDVKPDSKLEIKFQLENTYDRDEDIEIENIQIDAVIYDIDDGDDLEDDTDLDIKEDDKEDVEFVFDIPLEVEDDEYDAEIIIEGFDENDIRYYYVLPFTVEVEKEKHEILIDRISLTNDIIDCGSFTDLEFTVMNLGRESEEVDITVSSSAIDLLESFQRDLDDDPFDDDSRARITATIRVDESVSPGTYPITITADYGSDTSEEKIDLTVKSCEQEEKQQQTQETTPEKEEVIVRVAQTPSPVITAQKVETESTTSDYLLIGGMALIGLLILIAILSMLLRK